MQKNIIYSLLIFLMAGLCSCGSKDFKVEGNLSDKGRQNLRFVYAYNEGISSTWIPMVEGKFELKGASDEMTIVYVFNSKMFQIFHFVAQNGETIEIGGTMSDLKFDGNDINQRWYDFIKKHDADFKNGNTAVTDKAIEDYINANPKDVLSTLLLVCDYSKISSTKAKELLEKIDAEAKPESLLKLYDNSFAFKADNTASLKDLKLRNTKDSLVNFEVEKKGHTLLFFWDEEADKMKTHKGVMTRLKALKKDNKNLKIADVFTNPDTVQWYKATRLDSVKWEHYKALCGTMDKSIQHLDVRVGDFFILADSLGNQIYRGHSLDEVEKALKK